MYIGKQSRAVINSGQLHIQKSKKSKKNQVNCPLLVRADNFLGDFFDSILVIVYY